MNNLLKASLIGSNRNYQKPMVSQSYRGLCCSRRRRSHGNQWFAGRQTCSIDSSNLLGEVSKSWQIITYLWFFKLYLDPKLTNVVLNLLLVLPTREFPKDMVSFSLSSLSLSVPNLMASSCSLIELLYIHMCTCLCVSFGGMATILLHHFFVCFIWFLLLILRTGQSN